MPQTSDERRAKMQEYFGDPISDGPPTAFLCGQGYKYSSGWWSKPTIDHQPTEKELECLHFLLEEWDHAWDFVADEFTEKLRILINEYKPKMSGDMVISILEHFMENL